jgi:predicted Zn finger-like uncharacterized protein
MVSRLTCPECGTVLRPAKPLAPGKKVKCPRCENVFAATTTDAEEEEPRQPKAAPAGRKAAPDKGGRKPAAKAPVKEAPKKGDEEGIYGYIKDDDDHDDDDQPDPKKKKKPKIEYAPDLSIKDLRGPAQAIIMSPSNKLTLCGFAGVFGWLALIILVMIPALFPIAEDPTRPKAVLKIGQGLGAVNGGVGGFNAPAAAGDQKVKIEEERPGFFEVGGVDISLLADIAWYFFLLSLLPLALLTFYSCLVAYGAIQVQNLESRGWGMAGSIMAMLPLHTAGLQLVTAMVIQAALGMVIDDVDFIQIVALIVVIAEWLASVGAGVWMLVTLMNEEVIAGFEYVAE